MSLEFLLMSSEIISGPGRPNLKKCHVTQFLGIGNNFNVYSRERKESSVGEKGSVELGFNIPRYFAISTKLNKT